MCYILFIENLFTSKIADESPFLNFKEKMSLLSTIIKSLRLSKTQDIAVFYQSETFYDTFALFIEGSSIGLLSQAP